MLESREEEEEEVDGEEEDGDAIGSHRGGRGWNSLRAVVRYYCSLRKIKRQYNEFFSLSLMKHGSRGA